MFPQLGNKQYVSYWQDWLFNLATVTIQIQQPLLVCPGQTVLVRLKIRKNEDCSWPNRLVQIKVLDRHEAFENCFFDIIYRSQDEQDPRTMGIEFTIGLSKYITPGSHINANFSLCCTSDFCFGQAFALQFHV